MTRPVPPEPAEYPRVKKAMRAARFMKWGAVPLAWLAAIVAIGIGASSRWYVGLGFFLIAAAFAVADGINNGSLHKHSSALRDL